MKDCYVKYLKHWQPGLTTEDKYLGFSIGEIKGPMSYDKAVEIMDQGKSDQWDLLRPTTHGEMRIIEGYANREHLRQFIQEKYPITYDRLYNPVYN